MIMETLFCPYTASCEIYKRIPTAKVGRLRLDIIENYRGNHSCGAFKVYRGMEKEFGNIIGEECSHIRLLNLSSKS